MSEAAFGVTSEGENLCWTCLNAGNLQPWLKVSKLCRYACYFGYCHIYIYKLISDVPLTFTCMFICVLKRISMFLTVLTNNYSDNEIYPQQIKIFYSICFDHLSSEVPDLLWIGTESKLKFRTFDLYLISYNYFPLFYEHLKN